MSETKIKSDEYGLHNKFNVIRTDGNSGVGKKHYGCEYFVIDLHHDKLAPKVLRMYSENTDDPNLRDDLIAKAIEIEDRNDERIEEKI